VHALLDGRPISNLQSQAVVQAGQSTINFNFNFIQIFSISRGFGQAN
jgi:hypothetical protein